jgi:PAS domain S-box-containing protein
MMRAYHWNDAFDYNDGDFVHQTELFELFERTGDAAFVVDQSGQIRFWNASAARLLGFSAADARRSSCSALLAGCDCSGVRVCSPECAVRETSCHNSTISPFDLLVNTASGVRKWVSISVIVARTRGEQLLVHLMRDIDARHRLESISMEIVAQIAGLTGIEAEQILLRARAQPPIALLTSQEIRILQLLSRGRSTAAIGRELDVSPTTVRNHVQNILRKLGAHTRLEAVMCANRAGLI